MVDDEYRKTAHPVGSISNYVSTSYTHSHTPTYSCSHLDMKYAALPFMIMNM